MEYYVRDTKGRVAGPFSVKAIKQAALEGRILPTWHLSSTQEKWTLASKVPNLFAASVIEPSVEMPSSSPRLGSICGGTLAVFLDTFKGGQERFKVAFPWIQSICLWWIKLTLPSKGFIISEIGHRSVNRLCYDFAIEQPVKISEEEYEKAIEEGIGRVKWSVGPAVVLFLVGGVWALSDFGESSNPTLGISKLIAVVVVLVFSYIYEVKQSKVFIGFVLKHEIEAKMYQIRDAFSLLIHCDRVWVMRVNASDKLWKYEAASRISQLAMVSFRHSIPNIQTNLDVYGLAFDQLAIYFLPEKLLVIDGNDVHHIQYSDLEIVHDQVDHLHTNGQRFSDMVVVGHQWLHSKINGEPDMRFKVNYQIPIVCLGVIYLNISGIGVGLITTNPNTPETFNRGLPRF